MVGAVVAASASAAVVNAVGGQSDTASTGTPLATAVFDPMTFPANPTAAFAEVKATGATFVRIQVSLANIAPSGGMAPTGFDATDPAAPRENWSSIDAQVRAAAAAGLEPILDIIDLPQWTANGSQWLAAFAEGAAKRYSGSFNTLPRVRYWQAWNEPNLGLSGLAQRGRTGLLSPDTYRTMVNAFARGVKRVHSDNLVVAGGLAPYAATTGPGIPPLTFMKQFLCLTTARIRPRPSCVQRVNFDIWAIDPYTWGGPTHHATVEGDLALGDLPTMKTILDQGAAAGKIVSSAPVQFWVTEFSWDTNPPDPGAVAIDLQTRWTAQALYVMWQSGVSLVTWWTIRDQPFPSRWQSGLYFNGGSIGTPPDTPKSTLEAFRFPTVALPEGTSQLRLWARTPGGAPDTVVFEVGTGSSWLPVAVVPSDHYGVATTLVAAAGLAGSVRARVLLSGETSVPFSLTAVPDQDVNPFGN